jgi:RND family efflux transporter MFP subunit
MKAAWPEEVRQAEARHKGRKAAMDYATAKLQRARSLHVRNQITDDQMQEAQSLADQAQQAHAEAEAALAIAKGPREQAVKQAEQNVAVQQEEANAIQDQINKHTIRSPFAGYVTKEFTELGQWVAKAGMVATVAELDEVDVEVMVLENYLPNMRLGMPATVEIPALPGRTFQGEVAIIVPQADARSRTFPVKVRLQNQSESDGQLLFKAGMLARATLEVGNFGRGVLVPKDAVVLGGPKPVVYAVDPAPAEMAAQGVGGMVRAVPVDLGAEDGNWIAARGDLKHGDRVVTQGNERLRPGMPVRLTQ